MFFAHFALYFIYLEPLPKRGKSSASSLAEESVATTSRTADGTYTVNLPIPVKGNGVSYGLYYWPLPPNIVRYVRSVSSVCSPWCMLLRVLVQCLKPSKALTSRHEKLP